MLSFSGCSLENKNASTSINLNELTPQKLVETYYTSISRGDYNTAKDCLDEEYYKYSTKTPDSDFTNISKLSNIKVDPGKPIKLYGKNYGGILWTSKI